MGEGERDTVESLEQEVFRALDHQTRRDILRVIGEGKDTAFTEIMNAVKAPDNPTLSYHLRSLAPFIEQKDSRYGLTPLGKSAYQLLLRTNIYNTEVRLYRRKFCVLFGNTFLWICAIAAPLVVRSDMYLTSIALPVLAGTSLSIIYKLFE